MKTIAEITGLSLSTVSLSLRDGGYVKPETRAKVAKAAKAVGYVPNRAGVRLRTGRTNVLALVLAADETAVDFTRRLIQGIGERIDGTPYHLNVVPEFDRGDAVAAVRYILDTRSADGIILTYTSARDPRVQLLMDADFPFVCHGRTEFYTPHPYHDFNAECFVRMAVAHLLAKGRRRLLLAAVDNKTTNYTNIITAFRQTIASSDAVGDICDGAHLLGTTASVRRYGQSLAGMQEGYDAIITNNELTAIALIGGLQDKGMQLGEDYDLVCKEITEILPTLFPQMATVSEDVFAAGKALADLLLKRINGAPVEELQTLHEPVAHWRDIA